jgi:hypothetical protein
MVTVAELLRGFVSVPLKVAEPVNGSEPAAATVKFTVTCIVWLPARLDKLQVTVLPAVPGAGPVQLTPRLLLTELYRTPVGRVVVNTTLLAAVVWLFLTCQLMKSAVLTVGPPFAAAPVVWMSVVVVGAAIAVVIEAVLFAGVGSVSAVPFASNA